MTGFFDFIDEDKIRVAIQTSTINPVNHDNPVILSKKHGSYPHLHSRARAGGGLRRLGLVGSTIPRRIYLQNRLLGCFDLWASGSVRFSRITEQMCRTRARLRHGRRTNVSRMRPCRLDRSMPDPPENGAKTAPFSWNTCNSRRIATLLADMLFVHMRLDCNEAILGGQSHVSDRRLTVDRDRYGPATPRGKRSLCLGVVGP